MSREVWYVVELYTPARVVFHDDGTPGGQDSEGIAEAFRERSLADAFEVAEWYDGKGDEARARGMVIDTELYIYGPSALEEVDRVLFALEPGPISEVETEEEEQERLAYFETQPDESDETVWLEEHHTRIAARRHREDIERSRRVVGYRIVSVDDDTIVGEPVYEGEEEDR